MKFEWQGFSPSLQPSLRLMINLILKPLIWTESTTRCRVWWIILGGSLGEASTLLQEKKMHCWHRSMLLPEVGIDECCRTIDRVALRQHSCPWQRCRWFNAFAAYALYFRWSRTVNSAFGCSGDWITNHFVQQPRRLQILDSLICSTAEDCQPFRQWKNQHAISLMWPDEKCFWWSVCCFWPVLIRLNGKSGHGCRWLGRRIGLCFSPRDSRVYRLVKAENIKKHLQIYAGFYLCSNLMFSTKLVQNINWQRSSPDWANEIVVHRVSIGWRRTWTCSEYLEYSFGTRPQLPDYLNL